MITSKIHIFKLNIQRVKLNYFPVYRKCKCIINYNFILKSVTGNVSHPANLKL